MTTSEYLTIKYCPNIHALLKDRKFSEWDRLDTLISNQLQKDKIIKTNFIRLLFEIEKSNNQFAKSFSTYIDQLVLDILTLVPKNKKQIWLAINGKITNIADWNYLNPIGELSVLKKLIISNSFELLEFETKFPNGRKKDFLVKSLSNNKEILIEVVNIHLPVVKIEFDKIKEILIHKVQTKINNEVKNVSDKLQLENLFIIPVVWYLEMSDITNNYEFFNEFNKSLGKSFGITHQTLGFCTYVKTSDNKFIFGEASSIINNNKSQ